MKRTESEELRDKIATKSQDAQNSKKRRNEGREGGKEGARGGGGREEWK